MIQSIWRTLFGMSLLLAATTASAGDGEFYLSGWNYETDGPILLGAVLDDTPVIVLRASDWDVAGDPDMATLRTAFLNGESVYILPVADHGGGPAASADGGGGILRADHGGGPATAVDGGGGVLRANHGGGPAAAVDGGGGVLKDIILTALQRGDGGLAMESLGDGGLAVTLSTNGNEQGVGPGKAALGPHSVRSGLGQGTVKKGWEFGRTAAGDGDDRLVIAMDSGGLIARSSVERPVVYIANKALEPAHGNTDDGSFKKTNAALAAVGATLIMALKVGPLKWLTLAW